MNNVWNRVALVLITALAACSSDQKGTLQVSGTLKNIDKLTAQHPGAVNNGNITLVLYEIPFGKNLPLVQLDSVTIPVTSNSFSLKGTTTAQGMYDLAIQNGPMVPLVNDAKSITVDMDFADNKKFYTVNGSDASRQLRDFMFTYDAKNEPVQAAMSKLDSLKHFGAADAELIAATNEKNNAIGSLNNFLSGFMPKIAHPIVASFALGRSAETLPQNEFESALNSLATKFPEDANLADLKKRYDTYKQQAAERKKRQEENTWVGKQAPELTMPDVNGNNISLSSFKGKYVLVDFWASWCGPCRNENPNVVAAYNQFKDRNFTVLGVSLDMKKENWLQAIEQDGLTWTHISDLAYWKSKAVSTYKFEGIPFNVLLDPQGTIIGEGLRGDDLTKKLSEVLQAKTGLN